MHARGADRSAVDGSRAAQSLHEISNSAGANRSIAVRIRQVVGIDALALQHPPQPLAREPEDLGGLAAIASHGTQHSSRYWRSCFFFTESIDRMPSGLLVAAGLVAEMTGGRCSGRSCRPFANVCAYINICASSRRLPGNG